MIKINDTTIAKRAMVSISRFWKFAFTAIVCVITILNIMQKVLFIISLEIKNKEIVNTS